MTLRALARARERELAEQENLRQGILLEPNQLPSGVAYSSR
jgi:hypothetical protein